ncbi:MAG: hypothetical protein Kow0063_02680 [Anaerolineae bacterium]
MQNTATPILAEAIGEANVRAGPGIDYGLLGTIYNGARYRVIGQHENFPWLLIEFPPAPGGRGWVFADLVSLNAPVEQVPYLRETVIVDTPTPSLSINDPSGETPTAQVLVEAQAEVNVRFGPGIDYPRIGQMSPGHRYTALSRHALYPWLLIEFPEAPDGVGWVYIEVLDITGDIYSLPTITLEEVNWPTLTPTPPFVVTSAPPWPTAPTASTPATIALPFDLEALGERVLAYLLEAGFAPEEEHFASVFLVDLASGENFSLGSGIAYSGMSLIKIPILVTFYRYRYGPPDSREAELIANTMICSGNHTANALLAIIGGGDPLAGAEQVTETMRALGLLNTFIVAPFDLGEGTPVQYPVSTLRTEADQERAAPDPYNQTTPEDLGWLLDSIYQCAMHETGPLIETFPDQFTPTECRQIILAMSANQINVLTEAGVPAGTRVAHKHGWISDTHGDAAIIFTPGGDFVLTMAFFQPEWLPYELSWPTMAEITRLVYNAYNPDEPLDVIHPSTVDETCDLQGNPLLAQLSAPLVPPIEGATR